MSNVKEMEKLRRAIKKKALGYNVVEETVDYSLVDGEMVPSKRKTAKRHIPPDVAALKAFLDMAEEKDYSAMSDSELAEERTRLLKILAESEKEEKN